MRISDWSSDVCSSDLMVFQLDRYSTKAVLYTHCNSTGTPHMLRVSKIIDYGTLVLTHMARCPQRLFSAADLAATLGLGQPVVSKVLKEQIGRATCRERVCQYV